MKDSFEMCPFLRYEEMIRIFGLEQDMEDDRIRRMNADREV
jgi:hypothetical protein